MKIDLLRFYIDRFGIDGFRLLGHIPSPALIAADPSLADTALFFESFPFEELEEELEAASVLCEQDLDSLFPKETVETGEEENGAYSNRHKVDEFSEIDPKDVNAAAGVIQNFGGVN